MRMSIIATLIISSFLFVCTKQITSDSLLKGSELKMNQSIKVLFLQGDHYTRGYQHGYLLGSAVKETFHDILIRYMCKGNDSLYEAGRRFLLKQFVYEKKFLREAAGIIAGLQAANISLYDETLKRPLDSLDIAVLSSIEEMYSITDFSFGCSSISAWGECTKADAQLQGNLVITRHWDYRFIPEMVRNLMLVVHTPYEPDEQQWVGIGWAGMIGACSALSKQSVAAFLNYEDFKKEEMPNLSKHRSVSLSVRTAIEHVDYNSDGHQSVQDMVAAIKTYTPYFGSIIHAVQKDTTDTCAVVIESNNILGVAVRTFAQNTQINSTYLAATNHFRTLKPPLQCNRYKKIMDSLQQSNHLSTARSWTLLSGAGAAVDCMYSLTYVPFSGFLRISTTTLSDPRPAYERESAHFSLSALFKEASDKSFYSTQGL